MQAGSRAALIAVALFVVWLAPATGAPGPDVPAIGPDGPIWESGDGFVFEKKSNKTRRSVSGIACPPDADPSGRRTCLFAFDEGVEARLATVGPDRLSPLEERIVVRSGGGELDAEGAALDGDVFYVVGSHSAKRGTCASNPGSRHVVRFARDPRTGGVARGPSGELVGRADSGSRLWDAMHDMPGLAPYVGEEKCLGTESPEERPDLTGRRGVNIEGIAASGGRLSFGFRGPAIGGRVPILQVDAAGLFEGGPLNPHVTAIDVGPGRAIRDLQAVAEGLLILAGPDDDEASAGAGWVLGVWTGQSRDGVGHPNWLAKLKLDGLVRQSCDEETKPEAVALLGRSSAGLQLIVLSDGMCDGGPLQFTVPLPR